MNDTTGSPITQPEVQDGRSARGGFVVPDRVPWFAVAVYAIAACGLAWLVTLPLWLGDGLRSPLFPVIAMAMMYTPTVAALIVVFVIVRPARKARYLGLVPFRPVGKKIALFLLWPVVWLVLGYGAFFMAIACGWVEANWDLSAVAAQLPEGLDPTMFLIINFAALPLNTLFSSAAAFGEELGWRGFLTTALSPLGFWPSALISGVVWGVWHAPLILLGYNFFRLDWSGVALMCGFTLCVGVLLQWSRYWTRNVWPAVAGHGALNAATPLTLTWLSSDADPALSTILGIPGWIIMGAAILILFGTGILGRRNVTLYPAETR